MLSDALSKDMRPDQDKSDPLVLEPRLERLCVLRVVTIHPGETFRLSIDLVFRKRHVVDLDLEPCLCGGFPDVLVVRPLMPGVERRSMAENSLAGARGMNSGGTTCAHPIQLGQVQYIVLSRTSSSRTRWSGRWSVVIRRSVVDELAVRLSLVVIRSDRLNGTPDVGLDFRLTRTARRALMYEYRRKSMLSASIASCYMRVGRAYIVSAVYLVKVVQVLQAATGLTCDNEDTRSSSQRVYSQDRMAVCEHNE